MVSFWPFRSDETASFEKTLRSVTDKITRTTVKRDNLRASFRRIRGLWVVYSTFVYLLYAVLAIFVTGRWNWGPVEYSILAGSPALIYIIRLLISSIFEYLLSSTEKSLARLRSQREEAIEKFKNATKYNTTQQLLEKYGASPVEKASTGNNSKDFSPQTDESMKVPQVAPKVGSHGRTGIAPPPTANIQRTGLNNSDSLPTGQEISDGNAIPTSLVHDGGFRSAHGPNLGQSNEDFAPNAFSRPEQFSTAGPARLSWSDRIMDLLLGEDETRALNRLALICSQCRLVNGLAPPGLRTAEEVGKWRCAGCGAMNNEVDEVAKLLDQSISAPEEGDSEAPSNGTSEHM